MLKVCILAPSSGDACTQIRLERPLRKLTGQIHYTFALSHNGINMEINQDAIDTADTIIAVRKFVSPPITSILENARQAGKKVVYEIDDLLTLLPPGHPAREFYDNIKGSIKKTIEISDAVFVSSQHLAENICPEEKRRYIIPNSIDPEVFSSRQTLPPAHPPLTIGYMGGNSHRKDIEIVTESLLKLDRKFRGKLSFVFWGCSHPELASLERVKILPPETEYMLFLDKFSREPFDIGIAPLIKNRFNECKSNIKFLEYSWLEIPAVYSDITPYKSTVTHMQDGLLATNTTANWTDALELLITNNLIRLNIGANARKKAQEFTVDVAAAKLLEALEELHSL